MAKIPANILKMALDPLADSAQAIVRNVSDITADKVGALTRMADDVVDDWGWKGGKPGEITGGQYPDLKLRIEKQLRNEPVWDDPAVTDDDIARMIDDRAAAMMKKQFAPSPRVSELARTGSVDFIMDDFMRLENAGVPRAWTGKVLPQLREALEQGDEVSPAVAATVSRLMRPMTTSQRETFLSLLPEWEGSIEDLAVVARSLA